MLTTFLLRYQERYISPTETAEAEPETTNTKVRGESTDRSAVSVIPSALPTASTKTAVKGEGPDRSFYALSSTALPRTGTAAAKETLTYTYVRSEAPRNDDNRHGGSKVLPRATHDN